jgi:ATP-dependent helicase HrpB
MTGNPSLGNTGLPVEGVIDDVQRALADPGVAVLQAEPGAGKTTVVPLRLLGAEWLQGQILVLEPRRVAARAAAARMADLLGEEVGQTVGYVTRDDRRTGPDTRIEVVTDGILTRRLQRDPSLSGTAMVIFDEFHERHLQADLGLALTLDAREGLRPDLRVLVMSATLDADPIAKLMDGAPAVTSQGRSHPVSVIWRPRRSEGRLAADVASAVRAALEMETGDVLAFLPGAGEIHQTNAVLGSLPGVEVLPLHGALPARAQDRALRSSSGRRVVLATDLAETSVTVEGVGVVVDSGLARRPVYDPATGLSRLTTLTSSQASAEQRAGRAGRQGPGTVYRLWSAAEHSSRRRWPSPEIVTADLAGLALELALWGAPAESLRWLTPPDPAGLAAAGEVLDLLGATSGGRPTDLGRIMGELPVHPRLARMVLAAPPSALGTACLLAALLSERDVLRRGGQLVTADLGVRLAFLDGRDGDPSVDFDRAVAATVRRRAAELLKRVEKVSRSNRRGAPIPSGSPSDLGPLVALAYPDRLAGSRGGGRFRLRYGAGAALADHDPLATAAWLVAAEVEGPGGIGPADGRIRMAAPLDLSDIERIGAGNVSTAVRLVWDPQADDLRAVTEKTLDSLVLSTVRSRAPIGPATTQALVERVVAGGLSQLNWTSSARALQARCGWASRHLGEGWPDVSDEALAQSAESWLTPQLLGARGRDDLARVDMVKAIASLLGSRRHQLDVLVPPTVKLPSGRTVTIDFSGQQPRVSVRVRDLFGTRVHPTVAGGAVPITFELLSPAGRPFQVTADLPGFWSGSWQQIRRELAGRYPKHPWPEDPSQAEVQPKGRPPKSPGNGANRHSSGKA